MPKKSHRIASKQAQLSQRKRKGRPNIYISPQQAETIDSSYGTAVDASVEDQQNEVTDEVSQTTSVERPQQRGAVAARGRVNTSTNASLYLNRELTRIGIITAFILLIIGVLTIFLR